MSTDELGDDAAALDVADQHDRDIGRFGEPHISDVSVTQIDLGRASRTLDEDEVGRLGESREGGEDRRQQARRQSAVLTGAGGAPDPAVQHDLRTAFRLRLQQHRVHVGDGRNATGACLQRLSPADLAAVDRHRGVVRHVLRLERPHPQTLSGVGARQSRQQHGFADIRSGPLEHQRAGHQNSIPGCALTPARNGCLTRVISVTRSAISTSSGRALRPVTMMWRSRGFSLSTATTSPIGR